MRPHRLIAVLLLLAALCGGCSDGHTGDDMQPTMTADQAVQRVEEYVRRALTALPPGATLETISAAAPHACDDPTDNGPAGRVFASNLYWIRGLPQQDIDTHVAGLRRWFTGNGFGVVTDAWQKAQVITLENKDNGFRMSLGGAEGNLNIGASSPCVWPDGSPPQAR